MSAVLDIQGLSVEFALESGIVRAVSAVDLSVARGQRLGLVGESGSGKTTTALAAMGMIEKPGRLSAGRILFAGRDLAGIGGRAWADVRARGISYIPQAAMNALNPVQRVGAHFAETLADHGERGTRTERARTIARALERVGLDPAVARFYPHQLSGGMKQRVCIALSILLNPEVIVADEPSSALDVVSQRLVMQTLGAVQRELGSALILISHDMGLMAQFADDIAVMHRGRVVERGPKRQVIKAPRTAYTRHLVASVPALPRRAAPIPRREPLVRASIRAAAEEWLRVDGASMSYAAGLFGKRAVALQPLSLRLAGEKPTIIAVVGESGSGKSTLGSLVLGLQQPTAGTLAFEGIDIATWLKADRLAFRGKVQAIFQDPFAAFNPFYPVRRALHYPLGRLGLSHGAQDDDERIANACHQVGLDPDEVLDRFPHQLSGGQRQRIVVARALLLRPRLLVADEPVSMVDASLRQTILDHLRALRADHGVSILYITHDLATAYAVSDYSIVLRRGRIVEAGPTDLVVRRPRHPYTQLLIDSVPSPDPDVPWDAAPLSGPGAACVPAAEDDGTFITNTDAVQIGTDTDVALSFSFDHGNHDAPSERDAVA